MATEHSFDISAAVDMMEVKNALKTAKKEIAARYDFKGLAGNLTLVNVLLANGADKNARTKSGKTAADLAGYLGWKDIIKALA